MLLEDEWRSCNVSKHHPHGECLHKHIKHEITMCHDRTIAAEDRQQRLAMPIFRRQGLPKETQHPDQCHSQKQQHIENAAPVRHFQQHTSKHRRTNGDQSLDSTQRGKKACQFATVIKICGYGLRNDHASGSGQPLQQPEEKESSHAGDQHASQRRQQEKSQRDQQQALTPILVAQRPDEKLSHSKAYHAKSQAKLGHRCRSVKISGQFGQSRQIKISHKRSEGSEHSDQYQNKEIRISSFLRHNVSC